MTIKLIGAFAASRPRRWSDGQRFLDADAAAASEIEKRIYRQRYGADWAVPHCVGSLRAAEQYAEAAARASIVLRNGGRMLELVAASLVGTTLIWYFGAEEYANVKAIVSVVPILLALGGYLLMQRANRFGVLSDEYRQRQRELQEAMAVEGWKFTWVPRSHVATVAEPT